MLTEQTQHAGGVKMSRYSGNRLSIENLSQTFAKYAFPGCILLMAAGLGGTIGTRIKYEHDADMDIKAKLTEAGQRQDTTITLDEYPENAGASSRIPTKFSLFYDRDEKGCTHITAHRALSLDNNRNITGIDPQTAIDGQKHKLETIICKP